MFHKQHAKVKYIYSDTKLWHVATYISSLAYWIQNKHIVTPSDMSQIDYTGLIYYDLRFVLTLASC